MLERTAPLQATGPDLTFQRHWEGEEGLSGKGLLDCSCVTALSAGLCFLVGQLTIPHPFVMRVNESQQELREH